MYNTKILLLYSICLLLLRKLMKNSSANNYRYRNVYTVCNYIVHLGVYVHTVQYSSMMHTVRQLQDLKKENTVKKIQTKYFRMDLENSNNLYTVL